MDQPGASDALYDMMAVSHFAVNAHAWQGVF